MSLWLKIMRFFGLAEPAGEEEIIEYPSQEQKRQHPSTDVQVLDYRREAQQHPPQPQARPQEPVKFAVLRPDLNRSGRSTYSLPVYTENLRDGYIMLVDVTRLVSQNRDEARKIVDFLDGAAAAIHGHKFEVANNIYLFVPPNVQVKGDILRD
jgi:FtsZ-interacting cell division protein YlmF